MKTKKTITTFLFTLFILSLANSAYAAGTPTIVTGFLNLLNDASGWLLILVPSATALMLGYHALMKQMSDGDSTVVSSRNKSMKSVLIGGAISTSAVALAKAFLSYFS